MAQEEVCDGPFTRADWHEVLDAVEAALTDLDGAQADRLLDYAHHELRCAQAPAKPADVGRMAAQEAVLHWYDQDPDEAVRWGWTVLDTVGSSNDWPGITPAALLAALDASPLPESTGPEGVGLRSPPKGAVLRSGFLLTEPHAPVRVPGLIQLADKRGAVLETFWQDGSAFADDLLGPPQPLDTPRWYEAPPPPRAAAPAPRTPAAEDTDVEMRWDIEPECPWKGQPRKVEAKGATVRINRKVFDVKTADEQRAFLRTLRTCGEFRAARRFKQWREARGKLAFDAPSKRKSMERALLTPEPTRRKRKRG